MKFSIRDLMWLMIVVGVAVLWLSERSRLAKTLKQGDVQVRVGDLIYGLDPGQTIEVRRNADGGYSVFRREADASPGAQ